MLKNSILLLRVASTVTSKGMRNILLGWFFVNFYRTAENQRRIKAALMKGKSKRTMSKDSSSNHFANKSKASLRPTSHDHTAAVVHAADVGSSNRPGR
jgi:hypothetical protein